MAFTVIQNASDNSTPAGPVNRTDCDREIPLDRTSISQTPSQSIITASTGTSIGTDDQIRHVFGNLPDTQADH